MGNRALAHIEKIKSIYPIYCENEDGSRSPANNIEMAVVLDFHVVASKGQFKVGDSALYVEVDSILPQNTNPAFDFKQIIDAKYKIKAKKFPKKFQVEDGSKIISQGILFTPSEVIGEAEYLEGADLTEILGITKIIEDEEEDAKFTNEPSSLANSIHKRLMKFSIYRKLHKELFGNKMKGVWQDWMPAKSDEENIQKIFSRLYAKYGDDNGWVLTEKLEGQSISIYVRRSSYLFGLKNRIQSGVCSRTRNIITDDGSAFWKTVNRLKIIDKLKALDKDYFIRGEHCGNSIQGNIYGFVQTEIYIYDVWDIDAQRKLNYEETVKFCNDNGLEMVPVLNDKYSFPDNVQTILAQSNGKSVFGDTLREGIVARRKDNYAESVKFKSPEYLAKDEKKKKK